MILVLFTFFGVTASRSDLPVSEEEIPEDSVSTKGSKDAGLSRPIVLLIAIGGGVLFSVICAVLAACYACQEEEDKEAVKGFAGFGLLGVLWPVAVIFWGVMPSLICLSIIIFMAVVAVLLSCCKTPTDESYLQMKKIIRHLFF